MSDGNDLQVAKDVAAKQQAHSTQSGSTAREHKPNAFQEPNGKWSAMRFMSFVSLLASIGFGFLTLSMERNGLISSNGMFITFGFLVGAFAPKAVQRFAESYKPNAFIN